MASWRYGPRQMRAALSTPISYEWALKDFDATLTAVETEIRAELDPEAEDSIDSGRSCKNVEIPEKTLTDLLVPAEYSRKVILPNQSSVNIQSLRQVNHLIYQEKEMLEMLQDITLSAISTCNEEWDGERHNAFTVEEHLLIHKSKHRSIRRKTSKTCIDTHIAVVHGGPTGCLRITEFAEGFLQDFFEVCQAPNLAEIYMLAAALQLTVPNVILWFGIMQNTKRSLLAAEKMVFNKAPPRSYTRNCKP